MKITLHEATSRLPIASCSRGKMGNPVKPSTIEKVLKKVLSKKATEPLKLSKVCAGSKPIPRHRDCSPNSLQYLLK